MVFLGPKPEFSDGWEDRDCEESDDYPQPITFTVFAARGWENFYEDGVTVVINSDNIAEEFEYEIVDGEAHITKYIGNMAVVYVPEEIEGNPVTAIMDRAFAGCEFMTSVVFPNTLRSIGAHAFEKCRGLLRVCFSDYDDEEMSGFPDSLEQIGECAFLYCTNLDFVSIPNNVSFIGEGTFGWCDGLQRIYVSYNHPYYTVDDYGVLYTKDMTTLIQYPLNLYSYYASDLRFLTA